MKTAKRSSALWAGVLLSVLAGSAYAGETVYKGSGTYDATRLLMPMAGDRAAIASAAKITATITPSESGFMFGNCAALSNVTESTTDTRALCHFAETADNTFDIELTVSSGAGEAKIIGGSGKWKGASGTGTLSRKYVEGSRGSFEYTFNIVTP